MTRKGLQKSLLVIAILAFIQILWSCSSHFRRIEQPVGVSKYLQSFQTRGRAVSGSAGLKLKCQDDKTGPCCASWDVNADTWWISHPDWYVSKEDDHHFCFLPIQDENRAAFLRHIYNTQWKHIDSNTSCSHLLTAFQTNAGYSASVNQIVYGFWSAFQQNVPFQITKHRPEMQWMYASKNESSWAYCESRDMNCYFLPLSDCTAEIGAEQKYKALKPNTKHDKQLFQWIRLYATRPQQHVRKKVYDFITKEQGLPALPWEHVNCTAIHVRRGDAGFVKYPYRRYASVQEYIEKGKIQKGETIVLLTDDVSTIEEVQKYHVKDYTWIYIQKQRTRGVIGGFNRHIPSGDEALEVITIMAEVSLASQCSKLVVGDSGFVTTITDAMDGIGKKYKKTIVHTRMKESDAKKLRRMNASLRVENMWRQIDEQNKET